MSDIKKLREVIDTLEEQSERVSEFNGIVDAIALSKKVIEEAKSAIDEVASEQKGMIADSALRFDSYAQQLADLHDKLESIEKGQISIVKSIDEQKFVTPEQFEAGRDKILLRISELNFVTPDHQKRDLAEIEKNLSLELGKQYQLVKKFGATTILGLAVIALGVGYLARGIFS